MPPRRKLRLPLGGILNRRQFRKKVALVPTHAHRESSRRVPEGEQYTAVSGWRHEEEAKNMPSSEKDRLAAEATERRADFQESLSSDK